LRFGKNGNSYGDLKVYHGCMFSGKTDYLHRDFKRAEYGKVKTQCFKSGLHTRDGNESVSRRNNCSLPTAIAENSEHLLNQIFDDTELVIIDELQMFDKGLIEVINILRSRGISVIAAGLDITYLGESFGPTLEIAARANETEKLTAVCIVCGYDGATNNQLMNLKEGRAVIEPMNKKSIVIESEDYDYEARCERCFDSADSEMPNIQILSNKAKEASKAK
jgi:thymidine kinase